MVGLLAGSTALLVLAGLLVWSVRPRDPDLTAVRQAVEALALSPAVHARNASVDGSIRADLLVTATGEAVGELIIDGETYEFLDVDDQQWLRSANGTLPGGPPGARTGPSAATLEAELLTGRWVAVDLDALAPGWQAPPSPAGIAARVRSAIADPGAVEIDTSGPPVAGEPTIMARTPVADVYVSQESPHRVLRVSPRPGGGYALGAAALRATPVSLALDGSGETPDPVTRTAPLDGAELDVTGLEPDHAQQVYDDVERRVPELAEAADVSLELSFSTEPSITCGPAGCSVQASALARLRAPGQVGTNDVRADLTVDVSIEGRPAGRCRKEVSLPLNTPTPIGCKVPAAGPVFSAIREAKKAEAVAATPPGGTARWRVAFMGVAVLVGRADVDITDIRRVVENGREESACLTAPDACPEPTAAAPTSTATTTPTPPPTVRELNATISPQRQGRHLLGDMRYDGRGYFHSLEQAQQVLDAVRSGQATVLGRTNANYLLVRYDGVTGYNENRGAGYHDQPTNVFAIKGTHSVSVVPVSPAAQPVGPP